MLLRQYLRREAAGLVGWNLAVGLAMFPVVAMYRLLLDSGVFAELARMVQQLPDPLRSFLTPLGPDLTTLDPWLYTHLFGFLLPLAVTVYTSLAAPGILTREVDGRTMEFLLALPVRRSSLVLSRLAGLWLNLGVLHGVLWLSVGAAVALVGEAPNWREYALVLFNQYLVSAALAALLTLVTVGIDDLQKALFATLGLSVVMFFFPHTVTPDSPLSDLTRLSLFHYYRPDEVLTHGSLPGRDLAVLAVTGAVATVATLWCFGRRQLPA